MIINKEKDVQYVLANLDIAHIRELSINKLHKYYHMTVDDHLKAKRFDYYLPKLRTVIEFDGSQHFTPIDYFGGMDQFMSTVTTDFEKMNYCFDNNIKVIRLTQGTSSDFLAQAINDHEHNLITIKDNQLETQSIDRFDLPESFNVHIENQTLKSKIDQLNDTIAELQDELESLKNPQIDNNSESDAVYQTVQDMHLKGLLNVERLPEKVIYNYYVNSWLKENNSGAKLLSAIKFNKRLVVVMSQFGFKYLQNNNEDVIARIKTLETKSKLSFNLDVFEHLADCSLNLTEQAQSRCFVKEDNKITDHEIENYKARINQLGEIPDDTDDNIKSALILYYLTNIDHDPDVIAKLENF